MRLQLLTSAYNGLAHRLMVELGDREHAVSVHVADGDEGIAQAVAATRPQLIIGPTLRQIIPESVWRQHRCLIVHPGVRGDRGISSLDWAIQEGAERWGVTLLEAVGEVDAGDIWAWREFPVRPASKTSLFRNEVTEAAVGCVLEAVERVARGNFTPTPLAELGAIAPERLRPPMRQPDRAIDWAEDDTATVLRKLRAADTSPGVSDRLLGTDVHMFGGHAELGLRGDRPGQVFARRHGAICRATRDGAVWITHLRGPRSGGRRALKLPAVDVLGDRLRWVPEIHGPWWRGPTQTTHREIWYREEGHIGYLHFECYNGAVDARQVRRLRRAFDYARSCPTRVIVLMGGPDFFCNGIHLTAIEAAGDAGRASWENINALNDLIGDIIQTTSHVVVSAVAGDAAAGGLMMALAADRVYARAGVVLNPHYSNVELFGSEYWTYLLPRRVGAAQARSLTERARPVGTRAALVMGLIDAAWPGGVGDFHARLEGELRRLAGEADSILAAKRRARERDEASRPLAAYRADELARLRPSFDDPGSAYHLARRRFLYRDALLSVPARSQAG